MFKQQTRFAAKKSHVPLRGLGTFGGDGQMHIRSEFETVDDEDGGVPPNAGDCSVRWSTRG